MKRYQTYDLSKRTRGRGRGQDGRVDGSCQLQHAVTVATALAAYQEVWNVINHIGIIHMPQEQKKDLLHRRHLYLLQSLDQRT